MAQKTKLALTGTPGRTQSFNAKSEFISPPWSEQLVSVNVWNSELKSTNTWTPEEKAT